MRHIYRICIAAILFCLLLPMGMVSAESFDERVEGMAEVTGVRVSKSADKVRIVLDADQAVQYKKMILSNPDRVVVDIQDAWLSPNAKKDINLDSRFAGRLRVAQHDKTTVRVVVETKVGSANYQVFTIEGGSAPGRVVLDFGNIGPKTEQARIDFDDEEPEEVITPNVEWEPVEATPREDKKENSGSEAARPKPASYSAIKITDTPSGQVFKGEAKSADGGLDSITSLAGKKIVLDPGHGGSDSGAIGPSGVMEKNVTLNIAMEIKNLLVKEGATVYMTRTKDTEVSPKRANATDIDELQARCDVANAEKADIFVSIHMDSFSNGQAVGTTGYYYVQGSAKSKLLADNVRQGVVDQLHTQSRGTRTCNFYVVKHTDMPATLVEVAFISNKGEEKLINSKVGIARAAQGIADGIADYFG